MTQGGTGLSSHAEGTGRGPGDPGEASAPIGAGGARSGRSGAAGRYLLDTHVWLWMQADPARLRAATRELIEDAGNELLLSAASSWEIAIKYRLGKLALPEPPDRYVPDRLRRSAVTPLSVEHAHALRTADLPDHHTDPFDRLIVAQAQLLQIPVITADEKLRSYDVTVIPA